MRYASRVRKGHIINDRTWEQWKKNHIDELPEIERELKEEMCNAIFISTGAYDGNKKADFYINEERLMTYVISGENLITCYHIDFGLDRTGNKEILQVLIDNLERSISLEEDFDEKNKEKKENLETELIVLNAEIKELNAKLDRARGQKNSLEQELKNIDLEHKELLEVIEVAKEKIVRSKMAM